MSVSVYQLISLTYINIINCQRMWGPGFLCLGPWQDSGVLGHPHCSLLLRNLQSCQHAWQGNRSKAAQFRD